MKKSLTFEAALERLSEIVKSLEGGDTPLDKSLELFTEGTELVRFCTSSLEKAEQKIKILVGGQNGEHIEDDFKPVE